jgi:cytochrome P450
MEYNPNSPDVRANPYPYYAALRRDQPVYYVEGFAGYAVSRYDDVSHVLMHPEVFSSTGFGGTNIRGRETAMLISCDPPDHTRLRNLVNRAFTPRMVAELEPHIQEITDRLIEQVLSNGEFDLMEGLAIPLPVTIIAEILGVEPERRADFKRWSDAVVGQRSSEEEMEAHEQLMEGFMSYFEETIERRRQAPKDDLISTLVQAEERQRAITSDELVAFTILLLVAGNETTTNLIGNATLALLEHPDQLAKVLADRSLIPNLVEEALRYDAPVQFLFRKAMEDVEIAGTTIPKDAIVLPIYASANRDERKYPEPDRFDVTRDTQGHLAFGHGIHFCLGAPLARLEAKIALEALLFRLPELALTEENIERLDSPFLRGPKRLRLSFASAAVTTVAAKETI